MATWFWLALASNAVVWAIFFFLVWRRRWNWAALLVSLLHMLFSLVVSVAPFRSFMDADFPGLGLGFLRFEGTAATLPATLIFCWAVASSFTAIGKGRGRWMLMLLIGDLFMAVNFGGSTLLEGRGDNWRIQLGEGRSLVGLPAASLLILLFTLPFVASAIWAARRRRANPPPFSSIQAEERDNVEEDPTDTNNFRSSRVVLST